jgi:hypothetical protein
MHYIKYIYILYIKNPYICFDDKFSSSGASITKEYKNIALMYSFVMNPWGWQLVVETYVGVFDINYMCILFSAFVGCYNDCDRRHGVYNIKFLKNRQYG